MPIETKDARDLCGPGGDTLKYAEVSLPDMVARPGCRRFRGDTSRKSGLARNYARLRDAPLPGVAAGGHAA
jgi:hypothetical protein